MNFTSQICTTEKQSKRLLALGLKKETADMIHCEKLTNAYIASIELRKRMDELKWDWIPAWSLHRLIEMMPDEIFYEDSTLILGVFGDGVYYADNEYGEVFKSFDGNLYNCIIKCIEWLIKEGYFNKEYLED